MSVFDVLKPSPAPLLPFTVADIASVVLARLHCVDASDGIMRCYLARHERHVVCKGINTVPPSWE